MLEFTQAGKDVLKKYGSRNVVLRWPKSRISQISMMSKGSMEMSTLRLVFPSTDIQDLNVVDEKQGSYFG